MENSFPTSYNSSAKSAMCRDGAPQRESSGSRVDAISDWPVGNAGVPGGGLGGRA